MSKRFKFVTFVIIFLICIASILYYSEFRSKKLLDDFITNPDNYEKLIDSVSIYKIDNSITSTSVAIIYKDEKLYKELHKVLSSWEVKRVSHKDQNNSTTYKIDFHNKIEPIKPITFLISEDELLTINGREYELVKGDLNELLVILN